MTKIRARKALRRDARLAHPRGFEQHLELDVERAVGCERGRIQVQQRFRIIVGPMPWNAIRRQCFERDDPRRDCRGEAFRQERAERLVFPCLNIARRPVVQQAEAEHVRFGVADSDPRAQFIAGTDENAHLQLVIDPLRRRHHRCLLARWKNLPDRTMKREAGNAYRRSASVVADWHPLVIRQQRIVGPHQLADGRRMMDRRIEVRVIADMRGNRVLGVTLRNETALQPFRKRRAFAQNLRQRGTQRGPGNGTERHERRHGHTHLGH